MSTPEKKEKDPRTVILKGMRLSFMDGLKEKKKSAEDATPKHSFNLINEKSGKHYAENDAKIVSAMKAAGLKAWKDEDAYLTIAEDNPKRVTYKAGERFKNKETGKVYAGYEGNKALGVSGPSGGQKRPKMKDRHKRDVEEKDIADVFYGGSYADVIVSFFGTDKGSRGIFATCELVRSHQEGEPMGGGYIYDEDDLDEMDDLEDDGMEEMAGKSADLDDDDLLG